MKIAQELRPGNVFITDGNAKVVLKTEYTRSGRTGAVIKMKMKDLLNNAVSEVVYKAEDKFDVVILDKKRVSYSYFADPMYVFMDDEYNQYEIEPDSMGDVMNYLEDGMFCDVVFYQERPISVEPEQTIVREVVYTEPAVKGDTSGKIMKTGKLSTGYEIQVPAFVEIGDKIEIDTRTNEYRNRVK